MLERKILYLMLSVNLTINLNGEIIQFQELKNPFCGPLSDSFLIKLRDIFRVSTFIETGTFEGGTTERACKIFRTVHTIELSSDFYKINKEKFETNKNVFLYQGDSGKLLPSIINKINEKAVFWLDGHYSAGSTAKGETNTPILEELAAIKQSGLKESVILIDDIRMFDQFAKNVRATCLEGYPSLQTIIDKINEININYRFLVLGDILLAYIPTSYIEPSPFLEALTISRLYNGTNYSIELVLKSEKLIAQATGSDELLISNLYNFFAKRLKFFGLAQHYTLWRGLVLYRRSDYLGAYGCFRDGLEGGLNHWRIFGYLALAAAKLNYKDEEKKYLELVKGQTSLPAIELLGLQF